MLPVLLRLMRLRNIDRPVPSLQLVTIAFTLWRTDVIPDRYLSGRIIPAHHKQLLLLLLTPTLSNSRSFALVRPSHQDAIPDVPMVAGRGGCAAGVRTPPTTA